MAAISAAILLPRNPLSSACPSLPNSAAFISQSLYRPSLSVAASEPRAARWRAQALAQDAATKGSEAVRRLYVGNIPRNVNNDELRGVFEECGAVEKAEVMYDKYSGRSRRFAFVTMNSVEDANAAIEKLNDTEIGGRKIKVNVTEKPLQSVDASLIAEESKFVDSPYKVYVGNLSKSVNSDTLTKFFSDKVKVLGAKVTRVPGTSKSSGYGFVSFSSEEEVDVAIAEFDKAVLEGQKIRVNKA